MSYDNWKSTEPSYLTDYGDGGGLSADPAQFARQQRRKFWEAFDFAVRTRCVREFLHCYRGLPQFAGLVEEAEQKWAALRREAA